MTLGQHNELLDAFASLAERVGGMDERVGLLETAVEDVRKNAKGANNWGKIASAVAAFAPVAVAGAKAVGWL